MRIVTMVISLIVSLHACGCIVSGAIIWHDLPVVYGQGRQLGVRVTEAWELQPDPHEWKFYPWDQQPPATPDQSSVRLSDTDPLTIAVPMFQYQPWLASFGTRLTRDGSRIYLDGFTLRGGGMTDTEYGPMEFLSRIGALPADSYTLVVRNYLATDASGGRDFLAFVADPEGYAASHNLEMHGFRQSLDFAVVPEPSMSGLLLLALFVAGTSRRAGRDIAAV